MTTGRINQVTILNRSAETRRPYPPKEVELLPKWWEAQKRSQPQALQLHEATILPTTDSIAPTEFPKVRSATGHCRLLHR